MRHLRLTSRIGVDPLNAAPVTAIIALSGISTERRTRQVGKCRQYTDSRWEGIHLSATGTQLRINFRKAWFSLIWSYVRIVTGLCPLSALWASVDYVHN